MVVLEQVAVGKQKKKVTKKRKCSYMSWLHGMIVKNTCTTFLPGKYNYLPETNITPENRALEKEILIGNHHCWEAMLVSERAYPKFIGFCTLQWLQVQKAATKKARQAQGRRKIQQLASFFHRSISQPKKGKFQKSSTPKNEKNLFRKGNEGNMDTFLGGLFILNSVSIKPPIAARRSSDSSPSRRGETADGRCC